jgi:branched-chain amino acid transport system permease protein
MGSHSAAKSDLAANSQNSAHQAQDPFVDSLLAGVIALLLFAPLTALVLDGYALKHHWQRPVMLAIIVAIGRLSWRLFYPLVSEYDWGRFTRHFSGIAIAAPVRQKLKLPLLAMVCLAIPLISSKYWLTVTILALIYVLLGLGLNIVVGLAGLLDLGFVAFYAVGAYGYALGSQYFQWSFLEALPICAVMAATFGVILAFPVLRMHGDYLAIVTLGFGEIIRLVLNNWIEITGGPNGMPVPAPSVFGIEFSRSAKFGGKPFHELLGIEYAPEHKYIFLYAGLIICCVLMVYALGKLKKIPMGRAWEALREDEIACRSLGINHVTVKLSAFAMGAMVAGVAGVFFASIQGFINPASFTFFESVLILAIVVLGGMGSVTGVIIAALIFTIMPELLRQFADYRVLIFGILMVVMMVWRPRGLLKLHRPQYQSLRKA